MAGMRNAHSLSLQTVLIIPFVLQIFALVALTGWLSLENGKKAVNDLVTQLQDEVSQRITQHLSEYMSLPHTINNLNAEMMQNGILDPSNLDTLGNYFFRQIKAFPSLGFIYFATERGELIGIERLEDYSLQFNIIFPNDLGNFHLYEMNAQGERTTLKKIVPNFIPQKRPWYQAAIMAGQNPLGVIFLVIKVLPELLFLPLPPSTTKKVNVRE